MNTRSIRLAGTAAVVLAAAAAAVAQTPPANPNPTGVAVSPQTAADAQQRAVPRSDTGTVVRTGPTAADRTRNAATAVGNAASGAVDSARNSMSTSGSGSGSGTGSSGSMATGDGQRAARPDRN